MNPKLAVVETTVQKSSPGCKAWIDRRSMKVRSAKGPNASPKTLKPCKIFQKITNKRNVPRKWILLKIHPSVSIFFRGVGKVSAHIRNQAVERHLFQCTSCGLHPQQLPQGLLSCNSIGTMDLPWHPWLSTFGPLVPLVDMFVEHPTFGRHEKSWTCPLDAFQRKHSVVLQQDQWGPIKIAGNHGLAAWITVSRPWWIFQNGGWY